MTAGTGPLRLRRLLVVEDDPDTANLLQLYFSGNQYEVRTVLTGNEALSEARQRQPDAILLDINLPDLDGFVVCQTLRSAPRTRYIPIIFLTERTAQSDRMQGLSLGAQDYITKPFDLEELRLRLQNLLTRTEREYIFDPRTKLPTGRLIDEQLQMVRGQADWHVLTSRVEAFQYFVDLNGFAAGDNVIKSTAQLVRETVEQLGTPQDFIGQPGNDTFIIVTAARDAPQLAQQLEARFNEGAKAHYSFMDATQGYVTLRDASGQTIQAPLMSLKVTTRPA